MRQYILFIGKRRIPLGEDGLRAVGQRECLPTISCSQVAESLDISAYGLRRLLNHKMSKVRPLIESGLKIKVPEIGALMGEVLVRHDIVHRGGRTKDGDPITVSGEDVRRVVEMVRTFADSIETELVRRYPEIETLF